MDVNVRLLFFPYIFHIFQTENIFKVKRENQGFYWLFDWAKVSTMPSDVLSFRIVPRS